MFVKKQNSKYDLTFIFALLYGKRRDMTFALLQYMVKKGYDSFQTKYITVPVSIWIQKTLDKLSMSTSYTKH